MKAFRSHKQFTVYLGPYVTSFQWSRTATFGMTMRPDDTIWGGVKFRKWLARWWSGIGRWQDEAWYE